MKLNKFDIIKYVSWGVAAIAGIAMSWASDQLTKQQVDETLSGYIAEKTKGES